MLLACVLALAAALTVQGYMHHLAGAADDSRQAAGTPGPATAGAATAGPVTADSVPKAVSQGGPVVDSRGGTVRTARPADRTLALTFDDGPDPVWTPRILDVLRKHHVRATFFVLGSAAIEHPDLMRRIVQEGHEVGAHTLTHTELAGAPGWRRQLELQGAQQAITGTTGRVVSLLRPPYSSHNRAITDAGWQAMEAAADAGYLTVFSTLDSKDWQEPGVGEIEKRLSRPGNDGQVVLLHDGGGNREQTVAALDASLARLADGGYRVTTVGDAVGIASMREASAAEQAGGTRAASHELVVMVDGDTVFEPDTVRALVQPLADPMVGAVSGNTKVANRGGILGAWQHIEYVVGFNLDRRLFDVAECMPTVPGAIGAFRRDALLQLGGISDDTLAEDTDLTMSLCRAGWRVVYQDDARAWTEAPASLGALWRQRYRWCYGTLQAMWKHRGAVVQRGAAGKLGRRGLGYLLVLQVLLPLFAPVVDVFAVYGLIFLDPVRIAALWLAFLLVQFLMAAYAFRLDREPLRPLWTLPLQQFVYRQLMYLVVIQSVVTALTGVRLRWHRMERYGSLRVPPAGPGAAQAES
ncbi:bi-functional transferase/deacetylase [Arthrobacter sp. SW1]|nr:bi-functional transferase/deacetylase [Arthrobacter sp. SW1]